MEDLIFLLSKIYHLLLASFHISDRRKIKTDGNKCLSFSYQQLNYKFTKTSKLPNFMTNQNTLFPIETAKMVKTLPQKKATLNYMQNTSASQVAREVKKGCRLIGLTRGQFSLIDLIYSILKQVGKSKVICATWSAGIKDANTVKWMINSDLIESFLLVTDHSYVTRQSKYALQLTELFGKENIRTSELHAKFCLISNDNFNIIIRTSMNLNANKTCESFEIDEDIEIFKFYENFISETFNQMPIGFIPNSDIVNRALDRTFINLQNHFSWQSNE